VQIVPLTNVERLLEGHVDIRHRKGSIQPLRYRFAEHEFYDAFTRWVASAPSGVRLRLKTNTRALHFKLNQRVAAFSGDPRPAPWHMFINGKSFAQASAMGGAMITMEGGLIGDEAATLAFDDLPKGNKQIELWLPQSATVSITQMAVDDGAIVKPWPDKRKRIVFHGSSISHCMEAETAAGAWPAVAASLGDYAHTNMGWAGSCILSGLAARIIRDQKADAIVLKLGINVHGQGALNQRTFADSAHSMLSIIREKHKTTPIVVISPIWSQPRENSAEGNGLTLKQMRAILEQVVAARVKAGDKNIRYLSGLELFNEPDHADLPDDLHPNTAGYRRMGERFHKLMFEDTRLFEGIG
jgi:lysophospholipase L1-like esterase